VSDRNLAENSLHHEACRTSNKLVSAGEEADLFFFGPRQMPPPVQPRTAMCLTRGRGRTGVGGRFPLEKKIDPILQSVNRVEDFCMSEGPGCCAHRVGRGCSFRPDILPLSPLAVTRCHGTEFRWIFVSATGLEN